MPVRIIWIVDGIDALGIHRVLDVEQDSISGASAGCQTDGRVHGDVMALVGVLGFFRAILAMSATVVETVDSAGAGVHEDSRMRDNFSVLRSGQRNLDYIDAEQRGVRVLIGLITVGAPGQLFWLAHE